LHTITPARRAERARQLAASLPHASEALLFYARIVEFDGDEEDLRALAMRHGPQLLREAARDRREPALTFFRRVLDLRHPPHLDAPHSNLCPRCGSQPQAGVLRKEGDGSAFHLFCGVCLTEWRFPRAVCPRCGGEDLSHFCSEQLPHVQTRVCEGCGRYLHVVDTLRDAEACPDVDEIAALAVDVWAIEQGYEKIQPNLIGI